MMDSNDAHYLPDNQLPWDQGQIAQDTTTTSESESNSSDTDDEQEGAITQRIDHLLSYVS